MSNSQDDGKAPLLPGATATFGMVGPTAEDDIQRAIWKYGKPAVKAAVAKLMKPKKGRPDEKDWPELRNAIDADAREWLAGGDPLTTRTNYSIAKEFADEHPGQSHPSTMKRIERKLSKKPHDRQWFMLVTAERISRDEYPYGEHIRTIEALKEADCHEVWTTTLENARNTIARYSDRKGGPPTPELTMKEIEAAANEVPPFSDLLKLPTRGLFGNLKLGNRS